MAPLSCSPALLARQLQFLSASRTYHFASSTSQWCSWGYLTPKTLPNPLLPLGPFPRRRLRPPSIRLVAESGMSAASMEQLHAQGIIPDRAAMLRAQKLPSRADVQLGTTFAAGRANGRARPSCSQRSSPHPDVSVCFRSIVHIVIDSSSCTT